MPTKRQRRTPGYENGFKLTLLRNLLQETLQRKEQTVYFVSSMSDLFHDEVPFEFIDSVFETIRATGGERRGG